MRIAPIAALLVAPHVVSAEPASLGALTLAHAAAHFDLPVPHPIVDRFLRWELSARDLFRAATDRLASWLDRAPSPAPDLTILTTEPVANTESSGFGWRDDPIRHDRRYHSGADFRGKPGTPILAAGDGVVVFCGRRGGYGNVIYVDHGGGVVTRYAHLRKIETKVNSPVTAGERIAQLGSTGRTTGPHLHFEIRLDGRAVDPVTAMTIADLQRESPAAARLAAYALVPEIQAHVLNTEDQGSRARPSASRPERAGRTKRSQVLW